MAKVASSGVMIFLSTEVATMPPQPFNRGGSCTKIAIDHEGLPRGLKHSCLHVPHVHQLAPASSSNARLKQHWSFNVSGFPWQNIFYTQPTFLHRLCKMPFDPARASTKTLCSQVKPTRRHCHTDDGFFNVTRNCLMRTATFGTLVSGSFLKFTSSHFRFLT